MMKVLDIYETANECLAELDEIGIVYGNIVDFKVDTRAKRRLGLCSIVDNGFVISVSKTLLENDENFKLLKETILHEIIHTCEGCFNHGDRWKKIASIVNNAYDYDIKRAIETKEFDAEYSKRNHSHKVVCTGCGQEVFRLRECSLTQHPELWKCCKCGERFKRVY